MNEKATIIIVGRIIYPDHNRSHQQDWVQSAEGICRAIPAGTHASTPHHLKTLVYEEDNGTGTT